MTTKIKIGDKVYTKWNTGPWMPEGNRSVHACIGQEVMQDLLDQGIAEEVKEEVYQLTEQDLCDLIRDIQNTEIKNDNYQEWLESRGIKPISRREPKKLRVLKKFLNQTHLHFHLYSANELEQFGKSLRNLVNSLEVYTEEDLASIVDLTLSKIGSGKLYTMEIVGEFKNV